MSATLTIEPEQVPRVSHRSESSFGLSFGVAIFFGAFLLFQVQLIIGKYILPLFGGGPAVWTTCMLCFQILLLLGYAYAHFISSRCGPGKQGKLHLGLLLGSLVLLLALWMRWGTPLTPGPAWKPQPGENPVWKILELLSITAGLPFFLLSATGPLLQRWFSRCRPGSSVYRLYGLSNAGSLLGLLAYPFFFEWALTIKQQAQVWSVGYVAIALLGSWIAFRQAGHTAEDQVSPAVAGAGEQAAPRCLPIRRSLWIVLSSVSSIMLLATTNRLCQDVAVIPFLWVLPLSIYLFSFILTFESTRWYSRRIFWPFYFLLLVGVLRISIPGISVRMPLLVGIYSLALFAVCMVCHGELARSKPAVQHLTSFYFMVAIGGAAGGAFVVLIAPHLFRDFWEFQIALFGCGVLLLALSLLEDPSGTAETLAWEYSLTVLGALFVPQLCGLLPFLGKIPLLTHERYTLAAGGMFLMLRAIFSARDRSKEPSSSHTPWKPAAAIVLFGFFAILAYANAVTVSENVLLKERNFFGVKRVLNSDDDGMIEFLSASTLHGGELRDPAKRSVPTWYYKPSSGAGLLLSNFPRSSGGQEGLRVGLIGLGVGTLAAYAQPGDSYRFYEIDPAVVRIAAGSKPFFHFIADSRATVEVLGGDARLTLEREAARGAAQNFDVLVVDAFSGDSIPVHLLTREAAQVYLHHLRASDGVLAFHISNKYLDLAPVVQGIANSYHLSSVQVYDKLSMWILLSRNPVMLQLPNIRDHAAPVVLRREPLLWTDDYSNLFQILKRPAK